MIVGNKDRFGIEFELDAAKLADEKLIDWQFGRIRWWCGGQEVGRYEPDTSLRDVSLEAMRFLTNGGKRRQESLMKATTTEAVQILVEALYNDDGRSDEEVEAADELYRPFIVKPQVDVFDAWDIFLIEGDDRARLIWRRVTDTESRECPLTPGEFDRVLTQFIEALAEHTKTT
jgi:hypothetical protein